MIKAGVKGVKQCRINKILPQKKRPQLQVYGFLFIKSLSVEKSLHEFLESSIKSFYVLSKQAR